MDILKTGIPRVHFINDDWRDFALVVEFSPSDDAGDIRARFDAAAAAAVEIAQVIREETVGSADVIQFPKR